MVGGFFFGGGGTIVEFEFGETMLEGWFVFGWELQMDPFRDVAGEMISQGAPFIVPTSEGLALVASSESDYANTRSSFPISSVDPNSI